jgi:hypothetical protein
MRWEEEFGYSLSPERRSLDAVRDGFDFDASLGSCHVLALIRPDNMWAEDRDWLYGFLSIALEHSRFHLSLGRRFFTLVLPEPNPLVGAVCDPARRIPGFYSSACREINEFER